MTNARDEDRVAKVEDGRVFAKEHPDRECICEKKAYGVMMKIRDQDLFNLHCNKCGEIYEIKRFEKKGE